MDKQLIMNYIISLTNLYGLVHKDKVVEIYNIQNEQKTDEELITTVSKEKQEELYDNFVHVHGDYFVAEAIMEFDEFDEQLMHRKGKPFYIPDKEELLKYRDEMYFEVTKEYRALLAYVTKNLLDGDEAKAEEICEDIQGSCQFGVSMQGVFDEFNRRKINFKSDKQVSELMQLVMELANNTRIWENNGHTPNEIFELMEKPHLRPLPKEPFKIKAERQEKIGRNDPCPCGSGKKYKKCCMGKDMLN